MLATLTLTLTLTATFSSPDVAKFEVPSSFEGVVVDGFRTRLYEGPTADARSLGPLEVNTRVEVLAIGNLYVRGGGHRARRALVRTEDGRQGWAGLDRVAVAPSLAMPDPFAAELWLRTAVDAQVPRFVAITERVMDDDPTRPLRTLYLVDMNETSKHVELVDQVPFAQPPELVSTELVDLDHDGRRELVVFWNMRSPEVGAVGMDAQIISLGPKRWEKVGTLHLATPVDNGITQLDFGDATVTDDVIVQRLVKLKSLNQTRQSVLDEGQRYRPQAHVVVVRLRNGKLDRLEVEVPLTARLTHGGLGRPQGTEVVIEELKGELNPGYRTSTARPFRLKARIGDETAWLTIDDVDLVWNHLNFAWKDAEDRSQYEEPFVRRSRG